MPDPLFIVAPGRSYTSVVGGMIGQHPDVYGLPELNMSHVDTLGQMLNSLKGPLEFGMAGLLRLLAQLHEGAQDEEAVLRARAWILERSHWSIAQAFAHIQTEIGDKVMIDKSPLNVMRIEHLQRLQALFPNALWLHLTRHPRTAGKSSMSLRAALAEGKIEGLGQMAGKTRSLDPEKGWLRAQQNILDFSATLGLGQYMRIKAEMLLSDPKMYLGQICDWAGLSSEAAALEAMMHPEDSPYACLGPPSARFGNDPNFLSEPTLDFDRLARIKEPPLEGPVEWRDDGTGFSRPVLRLARQFGYG